MLPYRASGRAFAGLALASLLLTPAAAQSASDAFHRAYYLEHAKGDLEGALELYHKVIEDGRAPDGLRAEARRLGQACAEELACSDFARLVPAETIAYLELNRPGEQISRLLSHLGLLNEHGGPAFGVSPLLIDGALGMRGAAVAITHVDPTGGPPNGVVILHPGELDVVRGMIETALPVGGQPLEPIGGFPTYSIEGQAYVTLTSRLVIASPDPSQIEGVVARLQGHGQPSLATHADLAKTMSMRGDDLLFFCVNAEPVMPMIENLIASQAHQDPGAMMAMSLLDIGSTRSLAGRIGVDDDGLSMDVSLELDEGHRNLAFNLLRMPNIDRDSLAMIPAGVAFFCTTSLNQSGAVPPGAQNGRGEPVVTAMDFGREVFANIADVALYAMPSVSSGPMGPMPDVALAVRVNDPARSRALWNFVLGIAKGATSGGRTEPAKMQVAGLEVERYDIQGVPVFLATHGDELLISPSEAAIAGTLEKRRAGHSVLDDPVFASSLQHFGESSTMAAAVNAGRASEIARHFMSPYDQREMAPFVDMLRDTALAVSMQHSATRLGFTARICGIPDVSGVVSELVAREMGRPASGAVWGARRAASESYGAVVVESAPAADPLVASEQRANVLTQTRDELVDVFEQLNAAGQHAEARMVAKELTKLADDDAFFLNNLAWRMLTEEPYGGKYLEVATAMSKTSNEASDWSNWYYLDTYAHALFQHGKLEEAIETQKKALAIGRERGDPRVSEGEEALARFVAAAEEQRAKAVAEKPKIADHDETAALVAGDLLETFQALHSEGRHDAARKVLGQYHAHAEPDAMRLNDFAWALLTEDRYGNQYDALALEISKTSNELSDWSNWYYLDTYAHGLFQAGQIEKAIEVEKKAVDTAKQQGDPRASEAEAALKRFLDAAKAKGVKTKRVFGTE